MKVGFIGCGNMGGALARAVSRSGAQIFLADTDTAKRDALARELDASVGEAAAVAAECDYLFLGVKPAGVFALAALLGPSIGNSTTVVSMAAGVAISDLSASLGGDKAIIRIMPNTPVGIGEGMTLASVNDLVDEERWDGFAKIMKHSGRLDRIDERFIDAASAVSGSGPAFVYMFIEALADGGVAAGLPRDKALIYACQTLLGAARVVECCGKHPEQLKDEVCSPGGSTIEGVRALEVGGFRGTVSEAVVRTYEKARLLGKNK